MLLQKASSTKTESHTIEQMPTSNPSSHQASDCEPAARGTDSRWITGGLQGRDFKFTWSDVHVTTVSDRNFTVYNSLNVIISLSVPYENKPIQMYWKFYQQNLKILRKNTDFFHISAQNIDCGYSLEPPWWGGSNKYPQSIFLIRKEK